LRSPRFAPLRTPEVAERVRADRRSRFLPFFGVPIVPLAPIGLEAPSPVRSRRAPIARRKTRVNALRARPGHEWLAHAVASDRAMAKSGIGPRSFRIRSESINRSDRSSGSSMRPSQPALSRLPPTRLASLGDLPLAGGGDPSLRRVGRID